MNALHKLPTKPTAAAHPGSLPAWEDTTEQEQQAWRAAVSAIAGQPKKTLAEAAPAQSLLIQVGDQSRAFHTEFTAGRQGTLVINDEFASNHHARFTTPTAFGTSKTSVQPTAPGSTGAASTQPSG